MIAFSRPLAIVAGFALPLVETARRWRQLGDVWALPLWLDDWLIGGALLYGAWRTRRGVTGGEPVLAAAWGFACGMAYGSFFAQLAALDQPDPSGVPSMTVVVIKGVMFALAIGAIIAALRGQGKGSRVSGP